MSTVRTAVIALAIALVGAPLAAQWLNEPARGIPRLPDGKPNLSAPAPRTTDGKPDVSGVWLTPLHPGYLANVATDLEPSDVQAWAARLFDERMNELGKDDPGTIGCLPFGPRAITGGGQAGRAKIIQTPAVILFLYEDLAYRQIFMDGRTLPDNPSPSWMGYSVGHWEGNDLVVESSGFNDRTWLDYGGHPHTESLRITERYQRTDFGHMRRLVTLSDPNAFNKPITISAGMTLTPDTDLLEYVCAETPRETFHLVGRSTEEKSVRVEPAILAKYVGVYEFEDAMTFGIRTVNVTVSDGQLFADFNGKGKMPLTPLSETMFSPRLLGTYEFVLDARGVVTHLMAHGIEGSFKAVRTRDIPAVR